MQNVISLQEKLFSESITELRRINQDIAKMIVRKEELTNIIIDSLDHDHMGQKTYEWGAWRIEVKTPVDYALNKKLYESGEVKLPDSYNPIRESVSYSVNKKLCEEFMTKAPKRIRDALAELIEIRPGKAAVNIRERI